jgi:metal-sulfur cluster biosynthetic enzyme
MITQDSIIQKLKTIYDPEIPVNIYDLGLVYAVQTNGKDVDVVMTLTTATCPAAAFMPEEVKLVLEELPAVGNIQVAVVYEPKWTKERMSPEAKKQLRFA